MGTVDQNQFQTQQTHDIANEEVELQHSLQRATKSHLKK